MAIVKTQSVQYDNGFGSGANATATFTSALTSGSKLITFATVSGNTTVAFTDSAGNTWTTLTSRFWANIGNTIAIGVADNTSSASSVVVTATYGASGVFRSGGISEWTGLATGAADTFTVGNNSAGTTASDVAMTTTVAGDLIITAANSDGGILTAGSGFTLLGYNSSSATGWEYQVQGSAGSITPTITQGSAVQCLIISAAFAPAGGGGGPTPAPIRPRAMSVVPIIRANNF